MAFRGDLDALVLGVLADGGRHGYEITRRINEAGDGSVQVKEAQLYPVLHRLEAEALVVAEWIPQEGKPARKVYVLTQDGRTKLAAKQADWRKFAASVEAMLGAKARLSHV